VTRRALPLVILLGAAVTVVGETPGPTPVPAREPQVTLRWSAREEQQTYGYLVYRAVRREGPYLRINPTIVRSCPSPSGEPSRYEYVDRDVVPGTTYFYYLDSVSNGGLKARFSGVLARAVATGP
jgi:hypothetical protein